MGLSSALSRRSRRNRLRHIQREAEAAIDQEDPGPAWADFSKWLEVSTAAAISETFVLTSERAQWLAGQVADHFAADVVPLPVMQVSHSADVLDPVEFPAQGLPDVADDPDGLTWEQLTRVLTTAVAAGGCLGWSLAIYDPDQDPDRTAAARILALVGSVISALP